MGKLSEGGIVNRSLRADGGSTVLCVTTVTAWLAGSKDDNLEDVAVSAQPHTRLMIKWSSSILQAAVGILNSHQRLQGAVHLLTILILCV